MKERYLEVTFRKGKPLAAYMYLPRRAGVQSVRTEEAMPGVLVDYAAGGEPIGPGSGPGADGQVTVEEVNAVLEKLGLGSRWVLKNWYRSLAA